jgi:PAS domain S-box
MDVLPIPLLPALFQSSMVGVSVIDAKMRFSAINKTLAAMNGLPVERHIGKNIRHILGNAGAKVESAVQRVLQTGKLVSNLELTAELPSRPGVGSWVESFFPVIDFEGRTSHALALVLEVTQQHNIQRSLRTVIHNLAAASSTLKLNSNLEQTTDEIRASSSQSHFNSQLTYLVDSCLAEVQKIQAVGQGLPSVVISRTQTLNSGNAVNCLLDGGKDVECTAAHRNRTTPLTARERKVLELLAESHSNKEIALALGISVRTAETYRARIMNKLNLHSLVHLVRYAIRNGIVQA